MKRYRAIQLLDHLIDNAILELRKQDLKGLAGEMKELKEYVGRKLE